MLQKNHQTTSKKTKKHLHFVLTHTRLSSVRVEKLLRILFFETDLFQQISLQTRQVLNIFATHKGEMCRLDSSLHESRRTLACACVAALGGACRLSVWKRSVSFF